MLKTLFFSCTFENLSWNFFKSCNIFLIYGSLSYCKLACGPFVYRILRDKVLLITRTAKYYKVSVVMHFEYKSELFHYICNPLSSFLLSNIFEETEFYKSSYKCSFPQSTIRHKEILIRLSSSFIGLINFAEYIQRRVPFRVDNAKLNIRGGRKTCLLCNAVIGQLLNLRTAGVHSFWIAIILYLQK